MKWGAMERREEEAKRPTKRTYNETARVKPIALQDKEVIVSI